MATSDAPLNVPNVTLAVARGAGASGGSGSITWSGSVAHGQTLTINDSQSRFGTRTNVKPLYVNLGDGKAGSSLGRDTADYFGANAAYQTAIKAGQLLGGVAWDCDEFPSDGFGNFPFDGTKPLIQYLERYRDYDIVTDVAMRVSYINKTGTINIGDLITGQTSGATGQVRKDANGRLEFALGIGTIRNGGATFVTGETMTGPTGSVVNDEGHKTPAPNGTAGLQSTFNLKTNRYWAGPGSSGPNNIHTGTNGAWGNYFTGVAMENTSDPDGNPDSQAFGVLSFEWTAEEFVLENSSAVDTKDGIFNCTRGSIVYLTDLQETFVTRSTANPNPLNIAYLDQVSNGVGGPSVTVYGYQCWDDEYAGVYIGDAATRSACTKLVRQPQTAWSPSEASVWLVESQLSLANSYLYIRTARKTWVNDNGVALQ